MEVEVLNRSQQGVSGITYEMQEETWRWPQRQQGASFSNCLAQVYHAVEDPALCFWGSALDLPGWLILNLPNSGAWKTSGVFAVEHLLGGRKVKRQEPRALCRVESHNRPHGQRSFAGDPADVAQLDSSMLSSWPVPDGREMLSLTGALSATENRWERGLEGARGIINILYC